jgi:6 kDa early secretory antigenic target
MAGDFVLANFGSLSDGEAQFVAAYNGLNSTVNNLNSQLQSNLADWVGSAQQAYYEAKSVWEQAITDMGLVIQGMSSVISTGNQNYQDAERTNASMFT